MSADEGRPAPGSLEEQLARKEEEVRILRRISGEINSTLDLEEILDIVLRTMDGLFGFRHALILLLDPGGRTLSVAAGRGYPEPTRGAKVEVGTGVIGQVAEKRRILRVGNLSRHRSYAAAVRAQIEHSARAGELGDVPQLPGLPDVETQIAIPLLIRDRLVGVFAVESSRPWNFSAREETLVSIVGNLAASAIHNALLYRQLQRSKDELARDNADLADAVAQRTRELGVVRALHGSDAQSFGFDDIVGDSDPMREVKALLRKIAASPSSTVLITGENGTGKDLVARVIHCQSRRATAPFLNITCSAVPDQLLESELFGHERGAFTDARSRKKGLLELADGGSVFLDEIGEMSPVLQAKLLRFLEEKAFRRVGGNRDLRVDVRIIAATNRDLEQAVREGAFREDLYYRLRVLPVELPPLRERAGDVPALARIYLARFRTEFRKGLRGFTPDALAALQAYSWPGNVRELRNAVERAVLLSDGDELGACDFDRLGPPGSRRDAPFPLPPEGLSLERLERDLVRAALERAGHNKARAARLLGMDRDWIRYRIRKYGLDDGGRE